jgi:hypothetical protein
MSRMGLVDLMSTQELGCMGWYDDKMRLSGDDCNVTVQHG